ncbi:MAG: hypothetical protein EA397_08185 [Deltaproteobacteria bacterium]|nr:MAG: hypothetical protein EA397_08185 [Deltaproteobacteria bacterium]
MDCPRCATTLEAKVANPQIELRVCPACTGTLVPQSRLVPLLEMIARPLAHVVDVDEPIEAIPDKGGHCLCPTCRQVMESFGYMGTRLVIADRCGPCAQIWTDPDELGTMALLYLRTHKRTNLRNQKTQQYGVELTERVNKLMRSRAKANFVARHLLS